MGMLFDLKAEVAKSYKDGFEWTEYQERELVAKWLLARNEKVLKRHSGSQSQGDMVNAATTIEMARIINSELKDMELQK